MFCGVSLLTLTAISVDRLLALLLSLRYRQAVTLRQVRLLVVSFWLSSFAFLYRDLSIGIMYINMLLCIGTSTFCYIKIILHLTIIKRKFKNQTEEELQWT